MHSKGGEWGVLNEKCPSQVHVFETMIYMWEAMETLAQV